MVCSLKSTTVPGPRITLISRFILFSTLACTTTFGLIQLWLNNRSHVSMIAFAIQTAILLLLTGKEQIIQTHQGIELRNYYLLNLFKITTYLTDINQCKVKIDDPAMHIHFNSKILKLTTEYKLTIMLHWTKTIANHIQRDIEYK